MLGNEPKHEQTTRSSASTWRRTQKGAVLQYRNFLPTNYVHHSSLRVPIRYVFLLTTFKEATRRLQKEGVKLRDNVRATTAQFQLLHAHVATLEEKQAQPLTAWYDEVSEVSTLATTRS